MLLFYPIMGIMKPCAAINYFFFFILTVLIFKRHKTVPSKFWTVFIIADDLSLFACRVKAAQSELGTQILADFEEAFPAQGSKVNLTQKSQLVVFFC